MTNVASAQRRQRRLVAQLGAADDICVVGDGLYSGRGTYFGHALVTERDVWRWSAWRGLQWTTASV